MSDPCKIATDWATRIMGAGSLEELAFVGAEIKAFMDKDADFKAEWREWLLDLFQSKHDSLNEAKVPFGEALNERGKSWYRKKKQS